MSGNSRPWFSPGNFVSEGTTDRIGVTLDVSDYRDANPRILVRWLPDAGAEWVRAEYLYPCAAEG
jgi:hypothetical protein